MEREKLKDALAIRADNIDKLACSLRTIGHDVNIAVIEYQDPLRYIQVARHLLHDLEFQINVIEQLIKPARS